GLVQGVNFRAWTARQAQNLRLAGFVRNSEDGSVTGEACGSNSNIEKFKQLLGKGPVHAEVESVEVLTEETLPQEKEGGWGIRGFEVRN
ncbi:hypothetical protein JAAARDRAFT_71096, partial [Jaapia argillacea MUCL 33604]